MSGDKCAKCKEWKAICLIFDLLKFLYWVLFFFFKLSMDPGRRHLGDILNVVNKIDAYSWLNF